MVKIYEINTQSTGHMVLNHFPFNVGTSQVYAASRADNLRAW